MKCIKYYRTTKNAPKIVRVTNEEAAAEVAKGIAMYIPKSEWKRKVRDA